MFGSEKRKERKREAAEAKAREAEASKDEAKKSSENGRNSGENGEIDSKSGKRSSMGFIKSLWKAGLDKGKVELSNGIEKGKQKMEEALGLGKKPNVVPPSKPNIKGSYRPVYIGWHPVAGFAGQWFAEKSGLGRKITEAINSYPDPTQHWAVIVGDYVHQLWMDEQFHVIYTNEKVTDQQWHKFEVGKTSFNDEALRQAGEMVIYNMREKKPAYNLISNNCQNFAVLMLEAIQAGARREFATTYAIYQRAIGEGTVAELFEVTPEDDEEDAKANAEQGGKTAAVQNAQHVMDENTTKLDSHGQGHSHGKLHCC
ncbi:hypothetical protein V8F20_007464 [Naviculisporaceae sp. PSN 640]